MTTDSKIIITLLLILVGLNTVIATAVAPITDKPQTISLEEIYYQELTEEIIQCESGGQMVWGDLDKPHKAFGVAQFQKRTFLWLCKLSGKDLDYTNPDHQKELLKWALENNYGHLWTCYEIVKQK